MVAIEQTLNVLVEDDLSVMFTGQRTSRCSDVFKRLSFYKNSITVFPMTDDHTPFWEKGLDRILHLIPTPLPSVWHTIDDNWSNLDFRYIRKLSLMTKLFVSQIIN